MGEGFYQISFIKNSCCQSLTLSKKTKKFHLNFLSKDKIFMLHNDIKSGLSRILLVIMKLDFFEGV